VEETVTVRHQELHDFVTACYQAAGVAAPDAQLLGEITTELELRGVATHGAIRVPFYIRRLCEGGLNARPAMRVERDRPASAILAADHAPGQLAATRAMAHAVDKARSTGIGFVAVKDSDHFGASATFVMQAVREDMIGMAWSNGYPSMAAWGSYGTTITNGPLAYGIPAGRHLPIVLDIAMSAVAGGAVRLAAKRGQRIPTDWVVDRDGNPTDDPEDLPNGGALLPMGRHKGYGLAVVAEVMCGILHGGPFLADIPLWFANPGRHTRTGHLVMAVDITKFRDLDAFKADVDAMIDRIKAAPRMKDFEEILMPGEIEHRREAAFRRDGIPMPPAVLGDLRALSSMVGVPLPAAWR
jgi:LDH2 family malate/lactate/ureidoglycolate dehydrogenase